jgi:hypothetical protein
MPNEFVIKNGFRSQGNSEITGSIVSTSTITGNGSTAYTGIASTAFGATATLGYGGVGSTGGTTFDIFQNGSPAIGVAQGGNVAVGAGGNTANGVAKLLVRSSGTTSATTAFLVQNANASASLTIKDDNTVVVGISTPPTTSLFAIYGNSTTSSIDAEIYRDFSAVSARGTATLRITTKNTTGNHGNQAIDFRHEGINSSPSSVTTARIINTSLDGGSGSTIFAIQTLDTAPYAGSLRPKINIDTYGNVQLTDDTDAYVYLGNTYAYGPRTGKLITVKQQGNGGFTGDHLILRAGAPQNSSDRVGGNLILQGGQSTGTAASNILFQTIIPSGSSGTVTNSTYQTSMFISGSGNVGIGTSTPSRALEVFKSGLVDGSINGIRITVNHGSATAQAALEFYHQAGPNPNSRIATDVGSGGLTPSMYFIHNGINAMKIANTGNVQIGTTTDAGYKLDISGSVRTAGRLQAPGGISFDSLSPQTGNGGLIYGTGTGMVLQAYGAGSGNNRYGQVYVGTVIPTSNFLGYFVGTTIGTNNTVFGATSDGNNTATYFYFGNNLNNIVPSALVNIDSTTQGFLLPRMTAAQRVAISSPSRGLIVYDTSTSTEGLYYYNSGSYQGWTEILNNSGSQTITGGSLTINKSGSTVLDIQGSQGQLFSVIDALSGSLMSVNDVSGLPILEVFSDDRVVMGTYGAPALIVNGSNTVISGSLRGRVVTLSTASATASMDCSLSNFFDLTLSGSMYLGVSNIQPGETINLRVTQPATSGSLNYTSSIKFPNGLPYSASATSSVVDLISFISFDSSTLYATSLKNLI